MSARPLTMHARRLAFLAAVLAACAGDVPPESASAQCVGGCPAGLRCYSPTRECVFAGVAQCAAACASYEQCSARAPTPTCFAQVCSLPARPPTPLLKVVALALIPSASACDLDGDGDGDARLSEITQGYAELPRALDDGVAADRITAFVRRAEGRLEVLFGTLAPESLRCNPASPTAGCRYTVTRESYDRGARLGPCPAWLTLGDATLTNGALRAGAANTHVGIAVPIGTRQLLLQLHGVRADGTLTTVQGADATLSLRLCGAVPRSELIAALDGLPADTLAPVGGLSGARNLLSLALRPDIDGDGDGVAESVSLALRLTAVRADTTGWSPAP